MSCRLSGADESLRSSPPIPPSSLSVVSPVYSTSEMVQLELPSLQGDTFSRGTPLSLFFLSLPLSLFLSSLSLCFVTFYLVLSLPPPCLLSFAHGSASLPLHYTLLPLPPSISTDSFIEDATSALSVLTDVRLYTDPYTVLHWLLLSLPPLPPSLPPSLSRTRVCVLSVCI